MGNLAFMQIGGERAITARNSDVVHPSRWACQKWFRPEGLLCPNFVSPFQRPQATQRAATPLQTADLRAESADMLSAAGSYLEVCMGVLILADFRTKSWHRPETLEELAVAILDQVDTSPSEMNPEYYAPDKDSA